MPESIGAQSESQELAPHSALQRNFRKREEKMLLGLGTLRHIHCFVVNIALGISLYAVVLMHEFGEVQIRNYAGESNAFPS
jgi:hypothetical protein